MSNQILNFISSVSKARSELRVVERIDAWKESVHQLMDNIREYLSEALSKKVVEMRLGTIELNEELSGSYDIPTAIIQFGGESIRVQPRGTYVIGASGRVDLMASSGKVVSCVLMLDKQSESREPKLIGPERVKLATWHIALSDDNRRPSVVPLRAESFLDALKYLVS